MINIVKKELEFDDELKKKIEFIRGSIYDRLVLSIFLIFPLIILGVVLANSHISSNFFRKCFSIGNSSLIIFTIIPSFLLG